MVLQSNPVFNEHAFFLNRKETVTNNQKRQFIFLAHIMRQGGQENLTLRGYNEGKCFNVFFGQNTREIEREWLDSVSKERKTKKGRQRRSLLNAHTQNGKSIKSTTTQNLL